ncbi:MAG: hypothetical protein ABEJ22_01335 [Haloferacaceae archaeon]
MPATDDDFDDLARALVETDFDAVERDGLRAAWSPEGDRVTVTHTETGEEVVYNPDDLVRAVSDAEVRNAREPTDSAQ